MKTNTDLVILKIGIKAIHKFPKIRNGYKLNLFFSSIMVPINFIKLIELLLSEDLIIKYSVGKELTLFKITKKGIKLAEGIEIECLVKKNIEIFANPKLVCNTFHDGRGSS